MPFQTVTTNPPPLLHRGPTKYRLHRRISTMVQHCEIQYALLFLIKELLFYFYLRIWCALLFFYPLPPRPSSRTY